MATASGTMKTTSRQGTPPNQTLTMTIKTDPDPPGTEVTLDCSEDYFNDAKDYLGKKVDATYTAGAEGQNGTCTGLKGKA